MKIFFNCLVYKDNDTTFDMINNIKRFVKDPVIVLHVNRMFIDFDFNKFSSLDNVYINPKRLSHKQYDTKIKAIESNYDFVLSNNIYFDYEMIFYPKMLFIKGGIEEYIGGIDACMPIMDQDIRDRIEFALNTKMDVFNENEKIFFKNKIEKALVEGMIFSKSTSIQMYRLIKSLGLSNKQGHCFEEFIIPTVATSVSSIIRHYPGVVGYGNVSIEDIKKIINKDVESFSSLFIDNQPVKDIYFIHKVDYGYNNIVREFVRSLNA